MQSLKSHSHTVFVITVLLWYTAHSQTLGYNRCKNVTICITNREKGNECIVKNSTHILHQLSDLPLETDNWRDFCILLTSGTHSLSRNLTFSNEVEYMEIRGISNDIHSKIECKNESGIQFNNLSSTSSTVKISDIIFQNCGGVRQTGYSSIPVNHKRFL